MDTLRLVILGATGSIGTQALDVVRMHADRIEVVALAAGRRVDEAVAFAREFGCKHLAFGDEGVRDATALAQLGDLIMPLATHETLLPVDSEHSAIYQCYLGEFSDEARRIWLTCSGGPFRGMTREQLAEVTAAQALAHPTWNMGPKITIDSATLMNKGLEVIEAQHLFDVKTDDIRVVVHPQSCVHSMVEYVDGSVKAHLGVADMRIPIQFALSYPHRWESPATQVDFTQMGPLEFLDPDLETFRCLALALEAGRTGGTLPCVMNAANEVAVAAFLADACRLTDIDATVERVMEQMGSEPVESLEQLEDIDARSRALASDILTRG